MNSENPYASPETSSPPFDTALSFAPPQSVTFLPEEDDVLAAYEYIRGNNLSLANLVRKRQRTLYLMGAFFAILAVFIGYYSLFESVAAWVLCVSSITLIISAYRLPKTNQKATKKLAREMLANESREVLTKQVRITIRTEGFEIANEDGHAFRKWSAIHAVDRIPGQLIMLLTRTTAQGIPRSAFFDESSFEAYSELARKLWQDANSTTRTAS